MSGLEISLKYPITNNIWTYSNIQYDIYLKIKTAYYAFVHKSYDGYYYTHRTKIDECSYKSLKTKPLLFRDPWFRELKDYTQLDVREVFHNVNFYKTTVEGNEILLMIL